MGPRLPLVLFLAVLGATGCSPASNATGHHRNNEGREIDFAERWTGEGPIPVTCTTGMVADMVARVGGARVEVTQLMGDNIDPHLYKAAPGDVRLLHRAAVVFYSGLHLEGKLTEVFEQLAKTKPTFALTRLVPAQQLLQDDDGARDPHLWFDVALWSTTADVVRDVLAKFDPNYADEYAANALQYQAELAELHAYAAARLAEIPSSRRILVTAHDAFRYFGRAYDIEVRGIQGMSTESEAGVREINELVDLLVKRQVRAVFIESTVSDRNIQALIEGCQARRHRVAIGGELYSDAMGPPGSPAGTYVGMVRHNVDTIHAALQ